MFTRGAPQAFLLPPPPHDLLSRPSRRVVSLFRPASRAASASEEGSGSPPVPLPPIRRRKTAEVANDEPEAQTGASGDDGPGIHPPRDGGLASAEAGGGRPGAHPPPDDEGLAKEKNMESSGAGPARQ